MPRISAFARLANGNVAPDRIIEGQDTNLSRTMHGLAYDAIHDEIIVPVALSGAVLVFRGGATGDEPPLRVITSIADESDMFVIANIGMLRPIIGPRIEEGLAQFADQMAMMGAGANMDAAGDVFAQFLEQASMAAMGFKVAAAGVSVDLGAKFNEGSMLARTFAAELGRRAHEEIESAGPLAHLEGEWDRVRAVALDARPPEVEAQRIGARVNGGTRSVQVGNSADLHEHRRQATQRAPPDDDPICAGPASGAAKGGDACLERRRSSSPSA